MQLRLSDEQKMIGGAASGFLERACPTSTIVELDASETGFDAALWRRACELGWTAMGVPPDAGGLGGIVDLCLVTEACGRVALTSPLACTVAGGALPLALGGSAEQRARWLERLLSGAAIATIALLDSGSASEWSPVRLRGVRDGADWTLSGTKLLVPWAAVADVLVLSADLQDRGPSFVLVEPTAAGVTVIPHQVLGGDRRARVELADVTVAESDVLRAPEGFATLQRRCLDVLTVLDVALAVGLCETALGMSVQYAGERRQFGRPIGAFQAVSYRCVDMKLAIDACRLLCHKAAWHLEVGRPADLHVGAAKAYANEMVDVVTHNAQQVHGAIGFSTEYDLHLFTRRARAFASNLGTSASSLERVAVGLGLDD
ncbi:MAG TPA: acyl-CoA dehydrogenase family protein [Solirubrobacteraceae bacterium]|jgi:alkylation response protein AidB-like acyl-CoA dehydrogenase|nr:acyl-CoA dehydrogenase family protein [Solirubrobacteraceae bacterium]